MPASEKIMYWMWWMLAFLVTRELWEMTAGLVVVLR